MALQHPAHATAAPAEKPVPATPSIDEMLLTQRRAAGRREEGDAAPPTNEVRGEKKKSDNEAKTIEVNGFKFPVTI